MNFAQIKELKDRIFDGYEITENEAKALAKTSNIEALYYSANQIRAKFKGRSFDLCSVIRVESTKCQYNCQWCAFSQKSTTPITEYNIIAEAKALKYAEKYTNKHVKRISLASSSNNINDSKLTQIIELSNKIYDQTNIRLCASLGHLTKEQMLRLKKESRITTFQCNLQTSPELYSKFCTTCSYDKKIETIKTAREIGFDICCGLIVGMGESMEDRISIAIKIRDLGIKSIPIHILTPQYGIEMPLKKPLDSEEILTTIAIFRFINPRADIRLGGGRSLIKIIEGEALSAGINGCKVGNELAPETEMTIDEDLERFEHEGFRV
ncbi:MAG: biotin synthase BioB [Bacteroidales bacterium]|nr:biotin synthase BioB [Bacteroidales bacterium]